MIFYVGVYIGCRAVEFWSLCLFIVLSVDTKTCVTSVVFIVCCHVQHETIAKKYSQKNFVDANQLTSSFVQRGKIR